MIRKCRRPTWGIDSYTRVENRSLDGLASWYHPKGPWLIIIILAG